LEAAADKVVAKALPGMFVLSQLAELDKKLPTEIIQWFQQWGV